MLFYAGKRAPSSRRLKGVPKHGVIGRAVADADAGFLASIPVVCAAKSFQAEMLILVECRAEVELRLPVLQLMQEVRNLRVLGFAFYEEQAGLIPPDSQVHSGVDARNAFVWNRLRTEGLVFHSGTIRLARPLVLVCPDLHNLARLELARMGLYVRLLEHRQCVHHAPAWGGDVPGGGADGDL